MSTKTLSGTYTSGYTLSSGFTAVSVTSTGAVEGYDNSHETSGPGGVGLTLPKAAMAQNSGFIEGGAAGPGGPFGGADFGGRGGTGVDLAAGGELINFASVYGGTGGHGGGTISSYGPGGAGGAGVYASAAATVVNSGLIAGGSGGGAEGAGAGGGGGTGVDLQSGGEVINTGQIRAGYNAHYAGAVYPAGVYLKSGGVVINGSASNHAAKISGDAGIIAIGGVVENFGQIDSFGYGAVVINHGGRLIAEAGSTFSGNSYGGFTSSLDLAGGAGTLTGLGSTLQVSGSISGAFRDFASYVLAPGGQWTLTGASILQAGRTLVSEGSLALGGGVGLTIDDGAVAEVEGMVMFNAGSIALQSAGKATDLRILADGATFSADASVELNGPASRILGATATSVLTNLGDITGAGFIGDNRLTLDNAAGAVIDASGASGIVVSTKGETLTNAGHMEASTLLVIADTTVVNKGGAIGALPGGRVDLEDDRIIGGAVGLGIAGAGPVVVNLAGGELDGRSALTVAGVVEVVNGASEILDGAIANTGQIVLTGAADFADLIVGPQGATLSGKGQVNLSNPAANRIYGEAAADTLTNVDDRIAGAGLLGDGKMTLINGAGGAIVGNSAVALTINTGSATILNAGVIENVGKGGTVIASPLASTGTLFAVTAGTLTLEGVVTGAGGARIDGATLYAKAAFSQNVTFTGATGILELAHSVAYSGKISGLSKSGTSSLDLLDIAFKGGTTKTSYSGTSTSGTLTVTDGTHTARITLEGDYLASTFTAASDGHGGTRVVDPTKTMAFTTAAAAFAPRSAGALAGAQAEWRVSPRLLAGPRPAMS